MPLDRPPSGRPPARRPVTRRSFLHGMGGAAATAAAAALPRKVFAAGPRTVTFTLPWIAEASNLIAYVAKGNGYWSKNGLNVEIARGYGSVAAAEAIGAGKFDFGLAASTAGLQQTAKGLATVQIACTGYESTMGVGYLADSPIKTPKDLEGRQIASTTTSGEYPFFPAFAKHAGFDISTVKPVLVDTNIRNRLLPEHKVEAITGYAISAMPVYVATGANVRFMLYSHYGLPLYNNMLLTQPSRLTADPGLCEALTEGLMQAVKFTLLDPEAATEIFFKQVPEMSLSSSGREQTRVGLGIFRYSMLREPARLHGIGYSDPKDMAAMIDLVMTYVAQPNDHRPSVEEVMTNRFVGGLKLSEAEWSKALAGVKEFADMLS